MDFQVEFDNEANKPNNILEEIVWYKAVEIERWRAKTPLAMLAKMATQAPAARDFKGAILGKLEEYGKPGLIAEVKKASPSKGVIQPDFDAVKIAKVGPAAVARCLESSRRAASFAAMHCRLGRVLARRGRQPLRVVPDQNGLLCSQFDLIAPHSVGAECLPVLTDTKLFHGGCH